MLLKLDRPVVWLEFAVLGVVGLGVASVLVAGDDCRSNLEAFMVSACVSFFDFNIWTFALDRSDLTRCLTNLACKRRCPVPPLGSVGVSRTIPRAVTTFASFDVSPVWCEVNSTPFA